MIKRIFIPLFVSAFIFSCGEKKAEPVGETTVEPAETASDIVTLTALQIKTAGIGLGTIDQKNLQTAVRASGMLIVPNQNKALVTSVHSGVIKSLFVQPGNFVKKGQAIATIINPGIAGLQQQLQTVNAQLNLAQVELTRQKELVAGNAAPLKNVQRIETELVTLKATRNSLVQQLQAMGLSSAGVARGNISTTLTIAAPISGTISEVSAQIGSNVDASTAIAQIVNNSQLHVDLFVYEKDLAKLQSDQTIHFTLTNNPGKEYDAQIYSIGTAFVHETKTIPVHAIVKGDKTGLIEGMNISAVISLGDSVVPAVPAEAIVSAQGNDYIFLLMDGTTGDAARATQFKRIPVVKGTSGAGYTEVKFLEDLPANARIITRGAFFALAKMINTGEEE
ncbi:MAG: efflux RND transporter periplasmic adaptor subunit, partial [Ferruginibacter sp.]|nr:efflux RND transporter periplasmic adaptor subunit [Ferruginibacter sp.]